MTQTQGPPGTNNKLSFTMIVFLFFSPSFHVAYELWEPKKSLWKGT